MTGTIIDIVNAGSFWLLTVSTGTSIVDQPVEPRYMADIVEAEGLATPLELVGREIELSEDDMGIGLP